MYTGKLIFAQIFESIHPEQFRRYVQRYGGNHKTSSFSCWEQFLAMVFAQVTFRDSLADLEVCLRSRPDQLYHLGFRSTIAHSTLADANRTRDWRIYADLAKSRIARARRLYANEPLGLDIKETVYALDSTTIDLCLSLFPWARFRLSDKAAFYPLKPVKSGCKKKYSATGILLPKFSPPTSAPRSPAPAPR